MSPLYILPVNKQVSSPNQRQLLSLSSVRALVYIMLSSKNTRYLPLSLSQTQLSILPIVLLRVGHLAHTLQPASRASPPHCPLPLLSHCIRTRPSRTALSSEANTNQPQMFTLGEKEQQMQSHSIKLASLPLSLCLPLFPTFFSLSACLQKKKTNPGEIFRSMGVTIFSLRLCLIFQFLLRSESPGFPLKKRF